MHTCIGSDTKKKKKRKTKKRRKNEKQRKGKKRKQGGTKKVGDGGGQNLCIHVIGLPELTTLLYLFQDFIGTWPLLEVFEVTIHKEKCQNDKDSVFITNFLLSHKQIRWLTLQHPSLNLINEANKELSELFSLTLRGWSENYTANYNQSIHFGDNLKFLRIKMFNEDENEIPEMLIFEKVETLSLTLQYQFNKKWLEWLYNNINSNLTDFSLYAKEIEIKDFLSITKHVEQLNSLRISSPQLLVAENILNFMDRSYHVMNVDLEFLMDDDEIELLRISLPAVWDLRIFPADNEFSRTRLTFERYLK